MVSADVDKGIEFTTLLLILAHYKVIVDSRSLRLDEYLRRRVRIQRVDEAIRRSVVIGFFDTIYWSRRFRSRVAASKSARMATAPAHDFAVPEIFVQDESESPHAIDQPTMGPRTPEMQSSAAGLFGGSPASSGSRTDNANTTPGSSFFATPTSNRHQRTDSNISPNSSPTRLGFHATPSSHGSHASDASDTGEWHLSAALTGPFDAMRESPDSRAASIDAGLDPPRSRSISRDRSPSVSHQGMMDVLDNSAWGESIRRSFTLRRDQNMRQRNLANESGRPSLGSRHNSNAGDDSSRRPSGTYQRLP